MPHSFRHYNPLYRLNTGLLRSDTFPQKGFFDSNPNPRYLRFCACMKSFDRNYIRLHRLLDSIARCLNITYTKDDRTNISKYLSATDSMFIGNEIVMFFFIIKILLDDVAFFTPFYYSEPFAYGKVKDIRDSERPWSFYGMYRYFVTHGTTDREFTDMLQGNTIWTDEVCNTRNFLTHNFHDLYIHHDSWTAAYYAFLYEFNKKRNFIPNVLSYIAKTYYKLVSFLKSYEAFFKKRCEIHFPSFKYFHEGHTTSGRLDKTYLFFGGLGRMIDNRILIRIHPNIRGKIPCLLEKFLQEENISCAKCKKYNIEINPTVGNYILISAKCNCDNRLPVPTIVEKKFYPHFMDQNRRDELWGLIPYTLNMKS